MLTQNGWMKESLTDPENTSSKVMKEKKEVTHCSSLWLSAKSSYLIVSSSTFLFKEIFYQNLQLWLLLHEIAPPLLSCVMWNTGGPFQKGGSLNSVPNPDLWPHVLSLGKLWVSNSTTAHLIQFTQLWVGSPWVKVKVVHLNYDEPTLMEPRYNDSPWQPREQKEPTYLTTVNASLPVALQQVSDSQPFANTVSNLYILS